MRFCVTFRGGFWKIFDVESWVAMVMDWEKNKKRKIRESEREKFTIEREKFQTTLRFPNHSKTDQLNYQNKKRYKNLSMLPFYVPVRNNKVKKHTLHVHDYIKMLNNSKKK